MKTKKHVRKLTRVGKYSLAVVVPAELADELHLRERQKVEMYKDGSKIIIKDWKRQFRK